MTEKISLGALLRMHRLALGLTQAEVADRIGMGRANYTHVENGRRKEPLTPQQVEAAERLLGISAWTMLRASGYPLKVPGGGDPNAAEWVDLLERLPPDDQKAVLRHAHVLALHPDE